MNNQIQTTRIPTIVIVGHVCIDDNMIEGVPYRSWGSPPMYIAAYYARQYELKTHIISEYGSDFIEYIHDLTVMATTPNGNNTLIYRNIVENGHRTQYCPNPEDSLPVPIDGTISAFIASADILIVAPDIPNYSDAYISEVVSHASAECKKVLIPQGLLRKMDNTRVTRGTLTNPNTLNLFDAVIISDEDINDVIETTVSWSKLCPYTAIVVTRAEHGATLVQNGESTNIPTDSPLNDSEIINPVGAGDMFGAEFTIKLSEGASLEQSIRSAHRSTAMMLTSRGQKEL